MNPQIDAFVFDMDGTLLDTLPDLVDVTNDTMEHFGYPTHTSDEILRMVGNGLRSLITQAMPQGLEKEAADACIAYWKALYDERGDVKTQVYAGMMDVLHTLKAQGKKLAVLSNKYDAGTKLMTNHYFADVMDMAMGEGPVPRKPDPTGLLRVAAELAVPIERVAYVGDSHTDVEAAQRAGAFAVAVTWGYQPRERLEAARPDAWAESPADLLSLA
jgi:phosphoglycolate phosphatase